VEQTLIDGFPERGLTPPDPGTSAARWRLWIEENIEAFPEHLPGVSDPAW
jgi:hypothetical protein